jgi:hypothetical protein
MQLALNINNHKILEVEAKLKNTLNAEQIKLFLEYEELICEREMILSSD